MRKLIGLALVALAASTAVAVPASETEGPAKLLHVLDYIGVDYPPTVENGRVVDATEYAEMVEFAGRVEQLVGTLPPAPKQTDLAAAARRLQAMIEQRRPGDQVAEHTRAMREQVIHGYGVATAPRRPPDLAVGSSLFQAHCAGCHGATGRGNGPQAAGLQPPPTDFHNLARAYARSLYGLYSAITLGVEGTAMGSFSQLSAEQRWALAFYTGSLAFGEAQQERGPAAWSQDRAAGLADDLSSLVRITPAEAATRQGQAGVEALAYLRAHPEALAEGRPAPLQVAHEQLDASLGYYRAADPEAAYGAALAAYLEGFELAESGLRTVAPELVERIEHRMLGYRNAVRQGTAVSEVERRHSELSQLLGEAAGVLDDTALTPAAGFAGAFAILLREGLEAILILAAVGAVLVRTGRRDALPWLHAGWIAALAMGAATWVLSSYLIEISGAGRELTEGFTALLAAAVLLYVGFWLHGKTHSDRWQQFIRERIQHALHGRGLWLLALIAFLAVYREVFETVLFYQALWLQAGPETSAALWGGIGTAAAGLALLTWIIVRSSLRLPLQWFFGVNAAIMLVLAVAFAGHGIAGLQEAGWLPADPVHFPRFSLLGIYPTVESLSAQLVLVVLVAGVLLFERRRRVANG